MGYSLNIHIIPPVSSSYTFSSTVYPLHLFQIKESNWINFSVKVSGICLEINSGSNFILCSEPVHVNPNPWLQEQNYHCKDQFIELISSLSNFLEFLRYKVVICDFS